MTQRSPVRTAIVGAGLMGRWHASAARRAGSLVSIVIDSEPDRATRLASGYGARAATTLREAAAAGAVDVAHICTPLETHVALAREAIGLGLHVLIEKPLAPTASETEELIQRAESRGVLICPVHQFPFQRGVRRILGALNRIGPVLHLHTVACSAGADIGGDDFRDRVAAETLPHPLSLFATILDASLAGVAWELRRTAPGEWLAIGAIGATTLSLLVSMAGRPTVNSLRVIGARGTAHADLFHGYATIESGSVSRSRKIVQPFTFAGPIVAQGLANLARRAITGESAYPGLRELVSAFHAASRGDAPPPISPRRTLDIALARDTLVARTRSRAAPAEKVRNGGEVPEVLRSLP